MARWRTSSFYSYGRGRSHAAESAEQDGSFPLTRAIPKVAHEAGVTHKVARAALLATYGGEWHHVGKYAMRVNYYSVAAAVAKLNGCADLTAMVPVSGLTEYGERLKSAKGWLGDEVDEGAGKAAELAEAGVDVAHDGRP